MQLSKMSTVVVFNQTKQTELGRLVEVADTAATRKRGLLGRTGLDEGGGLWIIPSEAVHTFWMKFVLDLVFLDRSKQVTKVVHRLKAWRMAGSWRATSVVELPAGTAERTRTERGDQIEIRDSVHDPTAEAPPLPPV